ncbi:MAG: FixH family protein [Flavobacteriales bacterium]|nr:FixH family protein [Flavobacteriales bacterium]
MNWGKGLALALIAFAGMMAWFMVKASQNPEPLVTEDYYGEELRFQARIDEAARARALSAPVRIDVQQGSITLLFPSELNGQLISGKLDLLRPNAPGADHAVPFAVDSTVLVLPDQQLLPGRYNVALHWTVDGSHYFTEEKVFVP